MLGLGMIGEANGSRQPRPAFEGKLVRLRAYEPADYAPLNELFTHPEVLEGVGGPLSQPVAGFREFIEGARGREDRAFFVIETLEGRRAIGGCGLMDIDAASRTAVLGMWVARPHWDRGYGTDATRTLCRFGFRHMNLQRIELNVFATNPRAVHVYEKVGFRLEGTRRRSQFRGGGYVDSYLMGLLAEELVE